MKIGVNTLLWTAAFDRPHLDLLPRLKDAGFDGVEIARFDLAGFPAAAIRAELTRCGLQCTFCSALTGDLSLITDDTAVRDRTIAFLKDGVRVAAELGSTMFVGPFLSAVGYKPGRRPTPEERKRGVAGLQALGATLDEYGITLAVEPLNRFETYIVNTSADGAALCEQVGHARIGVLFDTFHANIEDKHIGTACLGLGKHLKHVHTCENDRGIPGSGHVDWTGLFASLRQLNYAGWLVIESFGFSIPEIAAAACIWRDLAPTPETIAFDGLRFLRQHVG